MFFNVAQLLKEPVGASRSYTVHELAAISDEGESLVEGEVKLTRTNKTILVSAHLRTSFETGCSRCLRQCTQPLEAVFEEEYIPTIDVVSGVPLPPSSEPGVFYIDPNHILDLTEAMRQYALLVMPMKPLCREDCAGLCPTCGHDLNLGPCQCRVRIRGHTGTTEQTYSSKTGEME